MQLIKELNDHIWMPYPTSQNSGVWNTLGDGGFDEIPYFNCPWTITTSNESIAVNITYLKWTFNYDFWIRVEIYSQGKPKASQLLDIDELHSLFKYLATALLNYYEFPEPHLNEFQLYVYGELVDHLSYKVDWTTIMANFHLAYPDLALDKFSGTDPDQDAESFVQLIEGKINFALGDAPADPDDLVSYTFRKEAFSSSLLRGPAAEWYEKNFEKASTWADTREQFITRFSDGRNKYRHRMEVEHCVRGDREEVTIFLHRIKKNVDKGWPDDMEVIVEADRAAERQAQGRQRRQRYMDYNLRGLRLRYLQRKAQEYLMERPNAKRNDFCAQINQKDLILEVSSTFLSHGAQTKAEMATLGQEIKNLPSELKEYHVNAVAITSGIFHPNQQGRQKLTRFCNYCHKNGNTLNWFRKKMRDEEVRKKRNNMSSKRNISPITNSSTEQFNRKPPNKDAMNSFIEVDDRRSPSIERLSNEEANWQHEHELFTPSQRRFFPRSNGMSFNMAEVTSIGESDGESSDPLALGYWSLQSLFYIFIFYPF